MFSTEIPFPQPGLVIKSLGSLRNSSSFFREGGDKKVVKLGPTSGDYSSSQRQQILADSIV